MIPENDPRYEAMVEAVAQAIHDDWQNAPGPHARTWEDTCKKLPAAAADFRRKGRSAIETARRFLPAELVS